MHKSPESFVELLAAAHPLSDASFPLLNLTFFTGAGFSKSWDASFPVGNALFSFTYQDWHKYGEALEEFLMLLNYSPFGLDIDAALFKDIVYQVGMMRKYPVLRPRYIDDYNLDMVERHLRYLVRKKFEQTAPLYYEDKASQKLDFKATLTPAQSEILEFFHLAEQTGDGSTGIPEGLRWNFVSTNYDYVIEAILDRCIGPGDFYTLHTYRGITPSSYCGRSPNNVVHNNWLVSNLFKVNGGFEVFKDGDGFALDYRTRTDAELRANPPQLMLASREQDYTQEYFHAMFPKIVRLLHESRILVLVGYSLPEEDALVRLIIKQFAEDRADGSRKTLFYIDLCPEADQFERVKNVFPHADEDNGLSVVTYSGSFSAWCGDVVSEYKRLTT